MKIFRDVQSGLLRHIILVVFVLVGGCMHNSVSGTPRPKAGDIVKFEADEVSMRTHFNGFEVNRRDIEKILRTWHQVSEEHWREGYHHVAFRDRTGTIRLKDGTIVRWMVKPGGLAMFAFQDGRVLYLAKKLTPWEKDAEPATH